MTMLAISICMIAAVHCSGDVHTGGQEHGMRPVHVSSGPLLFFVHPEDVLGQSVSDGRERDEVMYVYDPACDRPPQVLWRGSEPGSLPHPIARPTDNIVVFEQDGHLCVVELETGHITRLLETNDQTEFIEVKDRSVYFLEHKVPHTLAGYDLEHGQDGRTIIKNYYRPRDWLYVRDVDPSAKPRRMGMLEIERLLSVETDGLWVITAGGDRKLARIRRDGTSDEIIAFDAHWVAPETYLTFSPDGRYLALTLLHDQHDFPEERELFVVDVAKKRVVQSRERIDVHAEYFDNAIAHLFVDWLDPTRLWCSGLPGSGVIDVQNGTAVGAQTAAELRRNRPTPTTPETRRQIGYFESSWGLLYFKGDDKPVASVLEGGAPAGINAVNDLEISADGIWAAFCSPVDKDTYIVDGPNKRKSRLLSGWSYRIGWLPAVDD